MTRRVRDPQLVSGIDVATAELHQHVEEAHGPADLRGTLEAQAKTLDELFRLLGKHALESRSATEQCDLLRVGLRAQAQCVLTVKTLSELRRTSRPRAMYHLAGFSDAELAEIAGMEGTIDEPLRRLDRSTPYGAIEGDTAMEAVAEEHGTADTRG